MATVLIQNIGIKKSATASTTPLDSGAVPPLGVPNDEKRFWFQRTKEFDPDSIANQPSVFDDPLTAEKYQPREDW
ncbi:hypothetical protein AAE478_010305 [Parahypoxylon ruwenzoriense]